MGAHDSELNGMYTDFETDILQKTYQEVENRLGIFTKMFEVETQLKPQIKNLNNENKTLQKRIQELKERLEKYEYTTPAIDPKQIEMLVTKSILNLTGERKAKLLDIPNPIKSTKPQIDVPKRSPVLCPGCGHRTSFHAAKIVMDKMKGYSMADIGCYSLGYLDPHQQGTLLFSMGSGVPSASISTITGVDSTVSPIATGKFGRLFPAWSKR